MANRNSTDVYFKLIVSLGYYLAQRPTKAESFYVVTVTVTALSLCLEVRGSFQEASLVKTLGLLTLKWGKLWVLCFRTGGKSSLRIWVYIYEYIYDMRNMSPAVDTKKISHAPPVRLGKVPWSIQLMYAYILNSRIHIYLAHIYLYI